MMQLTILAALAMGLVQGLTEFLPVSSSAHLVFADHFLRLHLTERQTVSFDVLVHLGTLVAVLVYFRADAGALLRGFGHLLVRPRAAWREDAHARLAFWLLVATVPGAVAGKALKPFFQEAFQNVPGTAALLLVTAAMLFWIARRKTGSRTLEGTGFWDAVTVGVCQAIAILPGISRSGATITGGLWRGFDRDAAPRFSFLLSVPIILGGGLSDVKDMLAGGLPREWTPLLLGFVAAAASGYAAIVLLLGIVRRGRLEYFSYYCAVVGAGMLVYWATCVPQIDTTRVAALAGGQPVAAYRDHELSGAEYGQRLILSVGVRAGRSPVEAMTLLAPEAPHGELRAIPLRATAGRLTFESEEAYRLAPLAEEDPLSQEGNVRTLWLILRNEWGVENEVRLPLRVEPASLARRRAWRGPGVPEVGLSAGIARVGRAAFAGAHGPDGRL